MKNTLAKTVKNGATDVMLAYAAFIALKGFYDLAVDGVDYLTEKARKNK